MRSIMLFLATIVMSVALASCKDKPASADKPDIPDNPPPQLDTPVEAVDRVPYESFYPKDVSGTPAETVSTDAIKLEFFGWGEATDKLFTVEFPQDHSRYGRVILTYCMGGWNKGPSEWDNTTIFFIKNKTDGQWYELVRAFSPYGGRFGSLWRKKWFLDITEYLPMLEGSTEMRVYYGGFDATDQRAHTAKLTFDFYEGTPLRNCIWTAKLYDSSRDDNCAYRGWLYGVDGYDIEEQMCAKEIEIPAGIQRLELKMSISGHGHDLGDFPDRPGYVPNNAAEFVENTYTIKVDGRQPDCVGKIWISAEGNYSQAGTYYYDRANWLPGNPIQTQWWLINNVPEDGGKMSFDIDLERFISKVNDPRGEGVAYYIVQADLFGYDTW